MFITTSIGPDSSVTRAASARTSSYDETSHGSASTTVPPAARIAAAVSASPSAARSVRWRRAPSRAACSAVARPIPEAAPVTKTCEPAKERFRGTAGRYRRREMRRLLLALFLALAGLTVPVGPRAAAAAPAVAAVGWTDGQGLHVVSATPDGDRLWRLVVSTAALSQPVRVNVLLPAGYDGSRRYPTLYLFHGTSGGAGDWVDVLDAAAATAAYPMVVVMPDSGYAGNGGSWFTDWVDQGTRLGAARWETFHVRQLVRYVDAHVRTVRDRSARAVAGLSQGGFGALSYAARHPDTFVAAAGFSPAADVFRDPRARAAGTAIVASTMTGAQRRPALRAVRRPGHPAAHLARPQPGLAGRQPAQHRRRPLVRHRRAGTARPARHAVQRDRGAGARVDDVLRAGGGRRGRAGDLHRLRRRDALRAVLGARPARSGCRGSSPSSTRTARTRGGSPTRRPSSAGGSGAGRSAAPAPRGGPGWWGAPERVHVHRPDRRGDHAEALPAGRGVRRDLAARLRAGPGRRRRAGPAAADA